MPSNIADLPEYHDWVYDEPEYLSKSRSTNVAAYRSCRELKAKRHFHEAMEEYSSSEPGMTRARVVLGLPYHSEFATVFAQHIGGTTDDGSGLPLVDVEHFMETTYGLGLEQPDCEYLRKILDPIKESAQLPANVTSALQWLEAKQNELPLWPPQYSEPDEQGKKTRLYAHANLHFDKENPEFTLGIAKVDGNDKLPIEDLFLKPNFNWSYVDRMAELLGMIKNGTCILKNQDKGMLTGFAMALRNEGYIAHKNIKQLNQLLGSRYGVSLNTDRPVTTRKEGYAKTMKMLDKIRRSPVNGPVFSPVAPT